MDHLQEIENYYALREELDAMCQELSGLHHAHMVCQAGCSHCCMHFSIFPVEFYAIQREMAGLPERRPEADADSPCPFLVSERCTIYSGRPFICRTQGLPLLFMNDEQWELSACALNFTDYDLESFSQANTFPQDRFNSRLFLINKRFTESFSGKAYSPYDLIPLKALAGNERTP